MLRVLLMEINRVSSHWVWFATGGMELGALTAMTNGFRAREWCLDVLELITGLRMNHAYVRPGGVAQDLPPGAVEEIRSWLDTMRREVDDLEKLLTGQPIWQARLKDVGYLDVQGCHRARRHRSAAARRRAAVGPAQGRSRTAATRRTSSTCRPRTGATAGRATWSGWRRCASR